MEDTLNQIQKFLDLIFINQEINDVSYNGLQIENNGNIDRIYAGVDATFDFFKSAPHPKNALFLVHHGLYWRFSDPRTIGILHNKIHFCFNHESALIAYHLPLDLHPIFGNNSMILKKLGIETNTFKSFGFKDGVNYGFQGDFSKEFDLREILEKSKLLFSQESSLFPFGKNKVKNCAVISGSGGFGVQESFEKKIDLFITGEYSHSAYTFARDHGLNILYLTHYGSEKEGVITLGQEIARKFSIDFVFLDILPVF